MPEIELGAASIELLIEQMEKLGFYRYVRPNRVDAVKRQCVKSPDIWSWARLAKRDYPADEERLAECGVGDFLKSIRPILRASGVEGQRIEARCDAGGYSIAINGRWYDLYSAADVRAANQNQSPALWETTTRRSFALINRLFRDHGSDERIYSSQGWNDHWAFILTEALYTVLSSSELRTQVVEFTLHGDSELE